jgi:superkiller protein 3
MALAAGVMLVWGAVEWYRHRAAPVEGTGPVPSGQVARKIPVPANLSGFHPHIARLVRTALAKVSSEPDDAAAWQELAVVYDSHHFYDLARQCYERAVELNPRAERCWYSLAFVRAELGDLAGACAAMEQARLLAPNYAPAHWRVGLWKLDLGELAAAESAFAQAAALDAGETVSRIGLARVRLQQGEWDAAVELLEPIAASNQKNARYARQLLARAYRGLGRLEDAAAASLGGVGGGLDGTDPWRREIEKSRAYLYATVHEADGLLAAHRPDEAMALVDKLWEQRPDEAGLLTAMAKTYRNADRLQHSADVLAHAITHRPGYYPARLELARTLAEMDGREADALAQADEAIQLNPTLAAAHALRGELLLRQGDPGAAAESFHEAARCEPAGVRYLYQAALADMQLARWAEAAAALEVVTKRSPTRARVFQQLGVAYLNLGRLDDAENALRRAQQLAPRDQQTQAELDRLQAARGGA